MKFLKFVILLCLFGFFACEGEEEEYGNNSLNSLEIPCTSEMVFTDILRISEIPLGIEQTPVVLRAFIAANFPGRTVLSAREFVTKDQQKFTEIKVDQIGYLLFDDTNTYRCAVARYTTTTSPDIPTTPTVVDSRLEIPCTSELSFTDIASINDIPLDSEQISSTIREFIAAEFLGNTLLSAREFITKDQQKFIEINLDQIGYLLFDELDTYRCMVASDSFGTPDNIANPSGGIAENGSCGDKISFKFQVHPILVSNCAQSGCHNSKDKEDGISVETYEQVMEEIRPGNPNRSGHYESITEDPDDDDIMPERPRDPLLASEIKIIEDWINQGAENTDCSVPCDATAISFEKNIQPLFKLYCYGCHQANDKQGGVSMEDYGHILEYVRDGSLLGSMKHEIYYDAMPLYLDKMTDCQIAQVENWINEGAQNN